MKKPNFFIVGEPKCGTTSMHEYLKGHHQIYMSEIKEPDFFAEDKKNEYRKFKKSYHPFALIDKYLNMFNSANEEKIIGESSSIYLFSKTAAKNIYNFNPNAKILCMFREPVSFLISYNEYARSTLQENVNLLDGLQLEGYRKNWEYLPNKHFLRIPSTLMYSERVLFTEHLKRFLELFPKEQILVVLLEELKNDPQKVFKKVLNFLEVDSDYIPEFLIHNPRKMIRYKFLFFKILASKGYFRLFSKILPPNVYNKGYKIFKQLTSNQLTRLTIDKETITSLKVRFKPEVVRFNQLLHDNELIARDIDLLKFWNYDH